MNAPRREKRDIHGWLILDKPPGKTSTTAVAILKRLSAAKKVGHAGTLDPLASGVLPIAFGEATKTVSFVMDGRKVYRFKVRWGIETNTDDSEGSAVSTSDTRPSPDSIRAVLGQFTGTIEQTPPKFSALKIGGERAYDLARENGAVTLAPRMIEVYRLSLIETLADSSIFEAECGKGTYVRALARDIGRTLGCLGHVSELRRTRVGAFSEENSITIEALERLGETGPDGFLSAVLPVEASLSNVPAVSVSRADADRLVLGQAVLLRGRDAPVIEGVVSVSAQGSLVALAEIEQGSLHPRRIFHLPR